MDKYYKKISSFFIRSNNLDKNDSELYEYAIKVLVHGIINIIITILIGIIFKMLKECFCLFITFFILRKFTGGLHAKRYIHCLLSSIILMILALMAIKFFEYNSHQVIFIITVVTSVIIIWILSPIENVNKCLSNNEKKVYKSISIIISVIFLFTTIYLIYKHYSLGFSFGLGLIVTALLQLLSLLNN